MQRRQKRVRGMERGIGGEQDVLGGFRSVYQFLEEEPDIHELYFRYTNIPPQLPSVLSGGIEQGGVGDTANRRRSPASDQPDAVTPGRSLCHTPTPGACVASLMVNRSLAQLGSRRRRVRSLRMGGA